MTDPRESEPSEALLTITAGELVDFADAVRAYERCLMQGGDHEEARETAQAHYDDSRLFST
ncbi:hypothetical protein [Streptomyces tropicalis]|uniref:Uncharacterized protein n=1 Tax=Streptomyces tropicalis TaxID=3034234 RepID=A0ABT6A8H2_9ACTN|nr:hypothetical protein [Streptomyces tropicalis]MDF3300140.1 hypothetical protein [Streptomyces tropicalis]